MSFASNSWDYYNGDISLLRYSYRTLGNTLSKVPLAGQAFNTYEFLFDYAYSLKSWIENTYTTQNFINCFPYY